MLCATAVVLQLSLFTSCSNELTPEEQASLAAKGYYEHLATGEYDKYLKASVAQRMHQPTTLNSCVLRPSNTLSG